MIPFIIYLVAVIVTVSFIFISKNTVTNAAREAARQAAVTQQYAVNSPAWKLAVETVQKTLPVIEAGTSDKGIDRTFTPEKDVEITKHNNLYIASVKYHIPTPAPGMAKLFNPNAEILDKYLTVSATAIFPSEGVD